MLLSVLVYSSILKMKAAHCSETFVDIQRPAWLYIGEHRNILNIFVPKKKDWNEL
jgi:hypothetical protein